MVIAFKAALETFGHLLIRVYMIFLGYLAGLITFGLAVGIAAVLLRGDEVPRSIQLPASTVPFILLGLYYFFRLVLLIVSVAEILGFRGIAYYAGTWALTGYALSTNAKPFLPPLGYDVLLSYQDSIWTFGGIVAGIVYWGVAGRLARPLFRAVPKTTRNNDLTDKRQYLYRRP
jgi:hypothetical protein